MKINDEITSAIVDTGATKSYLGKDFVLKHRLELSETIPFDTQIADGKSVKIEKESYVSFVTENGEVYTERFFSLRPSSIFGDRKGFALQVGYSNGLQEISNDFGWQRNVFFLRWREGGFVGETYHGQALFIKEDRSYPCVEDFIKYYKENNLNNRIKCEPIKIKLIDDDKVVQCITFEVPYKHKDAILREISRLLDNDIIEEANTPFCSPGFIIQKKNGSLRFVIDYTKINENIIDDGISLSKIFENLQILCGNKYFSTLDLGKDLIKYRCIVALGVLPVLS